MDRQPTERPRARPPAGLSHLLLAALLGLCGVLLASPAARAHDTLTGSTPSEGSLGPAPEQVTLTFSGEVGQVGTAVEVTGPPGVVSQGPPEVTGSTVTVTLAPDLPAGEYTVAWRVTASDGHPISGEFAFGVEGAAQEEASPSAPTATDGGSAGGATENTTAADTPGEASRQSPEPDGGVAPWVWVVAAVALLGLAGVAVAASRRTG